MSEIKVNSIKGVGASAAAITVNHTDGTCTANISSVNGGQLSNRRLNINGAMRVAQRGTVTGITSSQYAGPDRYRFANNGHGTYTISQDSSAPTGSGFSNSLKIDCTTADTSLAANANNNISYRMEGQDCQLIRKGTSNAKQLALQFWVKSNKTGNYAFQLKDGDNIRSFTTTYTISSADTWEQKKIIIPADTTGVLGDDNGDSLLFTFWLSAGSDFTSGSASTSWYGNVSANLAYGHNVNIADSTSNTWYMTGFQVEIGNVHTDFEHRSFAQELALCNRYFQRVPRNPSDGYGGICNGRVNNSTTAEQLLNFSEMRATPTLTSSGNLRILHGGSAKGVTSVSLVHGSGSTIFFSATVASGLTAGDSAQLTMNNDTTAHIALSAEL